MPSENIEQLFCKEYESLKSENKNLSNHNMQLKDEVTSLTTEFNSFLSELPINEEFLSFLSPNCIRYLVSYTTKNHIFDQEQFNLLLSAKSAKDNLKKWQI